LLFLIRGVEERSENDPFEDERCRERNKGRSFKDLACYFQEFFC